MELPRALFGLNPQKIVIFFPKKTRSENISYIFSKERLSIISGNGTLHFSAQARKNKQTKKNSSQENSYIFGKMEIFSSDINPSFHNVEKWPKIFKVCLTIFQQHEIKG